MTVEGEQLFDPQDTGYLNLPLGWNLSKSERIGGRVIANR